MDRWLLRDSSIPVQRLLLFAADEACRNAFDVLFVRRNIAGGYDL